MTQKFFDEKSLVLAITTTLLMAVPDAPIWVSFFALIILIWKWMGEKKEVWTPPKSLTGFISIGLLGLVLMQYRTILGQEPSYTFLIGLVALKIMDYRTSRDHRFIVLLGFLLISAKAIFSIDFYWIFPSIFAFVCFWHSLLKKDSPRRIQTVFRVFLYSIPLLLISFFTFPRIVFPWVINQSKGRGVVGFSDRMDPGGISEIAKQNSLAFRAVFANSVQNISSLYWRGIVLNHSNGLSWEQPVEVRSREPRKSSPNSLRYQIMLEQSVGGYLFTLNYPKSVLPNSFRFVEFEGSVFRSFGGSRSFQTYSVLSDENINDTTEPSSQSRTVPPLTGRVKEWVDLTLSKTKKPGERLSELKRFFENPKFVYTLNPGTYSRENGLEEFLFERGRGFCEHYAGAYATLARALGVPSRVILGYHGGQFNLFGDFWRVSQKDAHAWVEVFHQGYWRTVDPTEWVAPLRLNIGAEEFFSMSLSEQERLARKFQIDRNAGESFADALGFWFENMNYHWTLFVLDFDSANQKELLSSIGKDLGRFILITFIFSLGGALLIRRIRNRKKWKSQFDRLISEVFEWGSDRGLKFEPSQTPLQYLQILIRQFPRHAEVLREVAIRYEEVFYKEVRSPDDQVKALILSWRKIQKEAKKFSKDLRVGDSF